MLMCGIAGYTGINNQDYLLLLNKVQHHRGPDDEGEYWDDNELVGLAMCRLSILDIEGGKQPMSNSDKTIIIVYNGEIFNSKEIRIMLEKQGVVFSTKNSDTEVILKGYETLGFKILDLLNGMFAFVIYDKLKKILFGARDPFGIKPLYLHQFSRGIAWSSELKALKIFPSFSKQLDRISVDQYFGLQYIPGERSIYEDAKKLEPGHFFWFNIREKKLRVRRYYKLPMRKVYHNLSSEETYETIKKTFEKAVLRWSMSDVPIACSLSGGIDSAAIVAILSQNGQKVKTYTLGFSGKEVERLNETNDAKRIANLYSTDHHEIIIDANDLLKVIPEMVYHLDEPYGGGLPSWFVFREIAKDVKVAMTGTGGDELFSNYNKFWKLDRKSNFMQALYISENFQSIAKFLFKVSRKYIKGRYFLKSLYPTASDRVRNKYQLEDKPLFWKYPFGIMYPTAHGRGFNDRLMAYQQRDISSGRYRLEKTFNKFKGYHLWDRCMAVDFYNQLPDEFLYMTDRFSMAHSLEARTPFLDKEFVNVVLSIPPECRFTPNNKKSLFKEALKEMFPVGYTKLKKKGFVIPATSWLQGPLRDQAIGLFQRNELQKDELVRPDFLKSHFEPFLAGQYELTQTIWTIFMFRLWQQTC